MRLAAHIVIGLLTDLIAVPFSFDGSDENLERIEEVRPAISDQMLTVCRPSTKRPPLALFQSQQAGSKQQPHRFNQLTACCRLFGHVLQFYWLELRLFIGVKSPVAPRDIRTRYGAM